MQNIVIAIISGGGAPSLSNKFANIHKLSQPIISSG